MFYATLQKEHIFSPILTFYDSACVMFARLMSEKCERQNLLRMGMPCLWPQELQGILYSVEGSVWSCSWCLDDTHLKKTESIGSSSLLGLGKLMFVPNSNCPFHVSYRQSRWNHTQMFSDFGSDDESDGPFSTQHTATSRSRTESKASTRYVR